MDQELTLQDANYLNKEDKRTLDLSSLGGALEFYDFVIYVFYAKIISDLFFPSTLSPFWAMLNTYGIFAAGYFFRPLGGVVMAHFGDLVGRKKLFSLSILLMALPTLFIGILPTFEISDIWHRYFYYSCVWCKVLQLGGNSSRVDICV